MSEDNRPIDSEVPSPGGEKPWQRVIRGWRKSSVLGRVPTTEGVGADRVKPAVNPAWCHASLSSFLSPRGGSRVHAGDEAGRVLRTHRVRYTNPPSPTTETQMQSIFQGGNRTFHVPQILDIMPKVVHILYSWRYPAHTNCAGAHAGQTFPPPDGPMSMIGRGIDLRAVCI